jgi:hypothetical protein
MDLNKRNFLTLMIPAVFAAPFVSSPGIFSVPFQRSTSRPAPAVMPSRGNNNNNDPSPNVGPAPDPKKILQKNQEQIHDNVEKIYTLAGELKQEMEKTDAVNVLSVGMLQKAEQIEKLAKQVRNLARGD